MDRAEGPPSPIGKKRLLDLAQIAMHEDMAMLEPDPHGSVLAVNVPLLFVIGS